MHCRPWNIPVFRRDIESLSELRGKSVALVFFPKAFSPGCTIQLSEYRDDYEIFQDSDTIIVAVSGDTQEANDRFRERHRLPFPVIGDPDHEIIRAYGVPARRYLGNAYAQRSVFLIDGEGIVRFIEKQYSVGKDKAALYEEVRGSAPPGK